VSHRLFYSRFGCTAYDTIYTMILFLRPPIPWKCGLVTSREDSVLSRVFAVLISYVCLCVCVCMGGGRSCSSQVGDWPPADHLQRQYMSSLRSRTHNALPRLKDTTVAT